MVCDVLHFKAQYVLRLRSPLIVEVARNFIVKIWKELGVGLRNLL